MKTIRYCQTILPCGIEVKGKQTLCGYHAKYEFLINSLWHKTYRGAK